MRPPLSQDLTRNDSADRSSPSPASASRADGQTLKLYEARPTYTVFRIVEWDLKLVCVGRRLVLVVCGARGFCFKICAVNGSVVGNLRLMRFERLMEAEVTGVDMRIDLSGM